MEDGTEPAGSSLYFWGLKQGFAHYDDQFDLKRYARIDLASVQRPGNEVMDAALNWLDVRKDKPFFAWIHLYDPHHPYEPPEPYRTEFGGRGQAGLYDGEIAFMDEQVGRLTAWLEKTGLDRSSVLVFVGDHGEALGSHGEGTHGYYIYDYAVHVPLIVVAPLGRLAGTQIAAQVSTADVFPSILGLLGLAPPVKVQGRSLVPLMFKPAAGDPIPAYSGSLTPNLQFSWSPLHALRMPPFKYIEAPRPELYDLSRDPGEHVGGSHILRGIGFEAHVGEVTVVLGRNGVGKTTLLKSLMGLVPVKTGTVLLDTVEVTDATPYERVRQGIGYVPQGREIFGRLTVEDNLRMGLASRAAGSGIPGELFELCPVLEQMLHRRGGDLSGCQQQQLAIARALAAGPKLLLLDEPTEVIQPSIIKDIGRVIRMLAGSGTMAIVLVEQYYDFGHGRGLTPTGKRLVSRCMRTAAGFWTA